MIDTNALLSIAFSMISTFTNIVSVPSKAVPIQSGDLDRVVIGGPASPTQMYLVHRRGTEFWIGHGIIYGYSSPDSFFRLQDPSMVPNFAGTSAITTNEAIRIAVRCLSRLVKHGDPLGDGPPSLRVAGLYRGMRIPFYEISWPKSSPGSSLAAKVEVDGRTGDIVNLQLFSPGFWDPEFEQAVEQRVGATRSRLNSPAAENIGRMKPTSEYVTASLMDWLEFCKKFRIDTGKGTELSSLDWRGVFMYEGNDSIYSNGICLARPCQIGFRNGAFFRIVDHCVFCYWTADAAFPVDGMARPAHWYKRFEGNPTKTWNELADHFQRRMSDELGLGAVFSETRPKLFSPREINEGKLLTRAKVCWCLRNESDPKLLIADELNSVLTVEFDLVTSEIKGLEFHFPRRFPDVWQVLQGTNRNGVSQKKGSSLYF